MEAAQHMLDETSSSFNNCAGKVATLNIQLTNDFSKESDNYKQQVEKIRREAYCGAVAGVILGPFGLMLSYSIAAGVVEGKLIPELDEKLESVKNFHLQLRTQLYKANRDVDQTKLQLRKEIEIISALKIETEITKEYVHIGDVVRDRIIQEANKLIQQCKEYQMRHGNR